jgi:hypothetical protein
MSPALIASLFFTVAMLVTTAYFLLGSVPLLILKHDTPMDSRFVRGFFNTYYLAAMCTAGAAAVSYAFADRPAFAAGAAALAVLATVLRRKIISRMDAFREQIRLGGTNAIPGFRRTHVSAIVVTLVQLVLIVWSLMTLPLQ